MQEHDNKDNFYDYANDGKIMLNIPEQSGREYIVDTGASFHCISKHDLTQDERKTIRELDKSIPLNTANGIISIHQTAMIWIMSLHMCVEAYMSPNCPPLISVGKLIEKPGFELTFNQSGAMLSKDEFNVKCELRNIHHALMTIA